MNENIKKYLIAAVVLIAVGITGYLLGGYGVSNGGRDQIIIDNLTRMEANQRDLTAQLQRFAEETRRDLARIERSQAGIGRAETFTREAIEIGARSDSLIRRSTELNIKNERIIREILKRNEVKGP